MKCKVTGSFNSLHFSVAPIILPLSFGTEVMNEGSFAQVSCIVREGDLPLDISWSFHGMDLTAETGISTTKIGKRGSVLMIPSVSHIHTGRYECKAQNSVGASTQSVKLLVNGKIYTL